MKRPLLPALLTLCATVAILAPAAACGGSPARPSIPQTSGPGQDYPSNILDSKEHRAAMLAEWQRVFDAYGVSPERRKPVELNPFTHTIRSLAGSGPIRLARRAEGVPAGEETSRLLLRRFIADHEQALGVVAATLSLEDVTDAGSGARRFAMVQSSLQHPIARPFGRLDITLDANGDIVEIACTAIPASGVPAEPVISRDEAARRLVGSAVTFHDKTGASRQVTIDSVASLTVRGLVIFPESTEAALRIRLAWEIDAGTEPSGTIYVDAITGETVATQPNAQT